MTTDPGPSDRRPIPARNYGWSKATTRWLIARGLSPNAISVIGMTAALVAGGLLAATSLDLPDRVLLLIAAPLILIRLLANMFDGMVAVESGTTSNVGEVFNEIPDRISDVAVLVGAGYAVGGDPVLGFAAACVAVMTAYVRAAMKVAGTTNDYSGPMAKQQRMWSIIVPALYLGIAPASWTPTWGPDGDWGLLAIALIIVSVGGAITIVSRTVRGLRVLSRGPQGE